MLATDCTTGVVVRFKDGFSRYLKGKRFKITKPPTERRAAIIGDPDRYIVELERLDVKRPYRRLAYADCLVPVTITLGETDTEHIVGNVSCTEGWCGGTSGHPEPCEREGCEGLVHAEFGDESYEGDYWLYTKCDVCGEPQDS